ncbi:unnamed protein product, partial [Scytosiphon promiscuus]
NIACCGAGTSADAVRITEVFFASRDSPAATVQRQHLRVAAAAYMLKRHLFRYQGIVSAALVLGGVDAAGAHLYQ